MHWIIQSNVSNEANYPRLLEELHRLGIKHSVHQLIPFTSELHPTPKVVDNKVLCIGSYSLQRVALANCWTPGIYSISHVTHKEMLTRWPGRMLNHGIQAAFADVPEHMHGMQEFFLRPATDEKIFAGKIISKEEFDRWHDAIVRNGEDYGNGLTPTTEVFISPVKTVNSEFRTWIVNGKVITASSYKLQGKYNPNLHVDESIINFAEECANLWSPHKAYCLDICKTPEGLKIVEPNTINCAGYYNADVGKLVSALEALEQRIEQIPEIEL